MTPRLLLAAALLAPLALGCRSDDGAGAGAGAWTVYDFELDIADLQPASFETPSGTWRVVAHADGRVLAQEAASPSSTFNVALADAPRCTDLELSVRFRSIAGEIDQGGGPVWRAVDGDNYYVCRYNPLESNFRVYQVVAGQRTQLGSADVELEDGWHEIAVRCEGERLVCSLDGEERLDVRATAFAGPGRVGLWTKADAATWFDVLRVRCLDSAP